MRLQIGYGLVVVTAIAVLAVLIGLGMLIPWAAFMTLPLAQKVILAGLILVIVSGLSGAILLDKA